MGGCLPGCCGCPCARGGLGWAGLGLLAHTEVVILSLTCTSVERSDHPDVPRQERRHSRLAAQFGVHGRSGSEPSLRPNSRGSSASVPVLCTTIYRWLAAWPRCRAFIQRPIEPLSATPNLRLSGAFLSVRAG
jgi:hypothetical protein